MGNYWWTSFLHLKTKNFHMILKLSLFLWFAVNVDKDECEYYQTHTINQYKTYEIVWHGYAIKGCGVGFYAVGDSIFSFDDYKICVKPVVWDMEDCSSQLYPRYNSVKVLKSSLHFGVPCSIVNLNSVFGACAPSPINKGTIVQGVLVTHHCRF